MRICLAPIGVGGWGTHYISVSYEISPPRIVHAPQHRLLVMHMTARH